jgi:predicted glutamine amidotransferase
MCGIVGLIAKRKTGFYKTDWDTFRQLLWADQLRGTNGTGVYFNTQKDKVAVRIIKDAISASAFINTKEFDNAEAQFIKEAQFIVGHNRAATKGKIDKACTHPFREKHIVLVHNGTISNHNLLGDAEVDSNAIAQSIAEIGAKETLKKIDGAFALVWFDQKEKTLNLCRNNQRPLNLVETNNSYIICSEPEMGEWVGKRNRLGFVKTINIEPKKIYKFKQDTPGTFETEDVEYKNTWKEQEWNYSPSNWKNKLKEYKSGERVRFRASNIKYKGYNNQVTYIEGDINKYPFAKIIDFKVDFEDEWRINYFSDIEDLKTIENCADLEGTVHFIRISEGKTSYTIKDIKAWEPKSPNSFALTTLNLCEDCGLEITGKPHDINGFKMCKDCYNDVNPIFKFFGRK